MKVPIPATKDEVEKLVRKMLEHPPESYQHFIRDQRDQFALSDSVRRMADEFYSMAMKVGPMSIVVSALLSGFCLGRWMEREQVEQDDKLAQAWGMTGAAEAPGPDPAGFDPDAERKFLESQLRELDENGGDKEGRK